MVDHKTIYQRQANQYQRLITREDYQGNLLPAIKELIDGDELSVLDLGAGTGRLSILLAPLIDRVFAFDLSHHMIQVAAEKLDAKGTGSWGAAVADHRFLPLRNKSVDLVLSGWSFCYLVVWEGDSWKLELEKGLAEIFRVLKKGGLIILIETLGTGVEKPEIPKDLIEYYSYLDGAGFQRKWIRTDYRFNSWDEGEKLSNFFFGREMVLNLIPGAKPILPECTGIWWKRS